MEHPHGCCSNSSGVRTFPIESILHFPHPKSSKLIKLTQPRRLAKQASNFELWQVINFFSWLLWQFSKIIPISNFVQKATESPDSHSYLLGCLFNPFTPNRVVCLRQITLWGVFWISVHRKTTKRPIFEHLITMNVVVNNSIHNSSFEDWVCLALRIYIS